MSFAPDEFARRAVAASGAEAARLEPIVGLGAVNYVYVADTAHSRWVVRFHLDPLDTDDYAKEEWCLAAARKAGVPVPDFIDRGELEGRAYIIQSFVEGEHGDRRRSADLWRTLGEYGKAIAEISLHGAPDSLFPRFGRDPIENWKKHVAYNIGELNDQDRLIELGVYLLRDQSRIREVFLDLEPKIERFGLAHGDLVPKNTIVPYRGRPVLIDWGSAYVNPTPFDSLLRVKTGTAEEGFVGQDLEEFAKGFDVNLTAIEPTLNSLLLLNRIDVVRWAIDRRPDRIPDTVESAKAAVARLFTPRECTAERQSSHDKAYPDFRLSS